MSYRSKDEDLFERVPAWLRWVLILPVAIITGATILFGYQIAYWVLNFIDDLFPPFNLAGDWIELVLLTPVALMLGVAGFIGMGAACAPKGRPIVGCLLALLPLALVAVNVYIRIRGFTDPAFPMWRFALDSVGVLGGVGFGLNSAIFMPSHNEEYHAYS